MSEKKPFWEKLEANPLGRLMLYVFLFALSERLIVTIVFFLRWGFHTVSGIELWFYYGVAKGTFDLYSGWDPSWWILKTLGFIFSGKILLYSVYLTSSLSSSLNSALFCLLVSELHNKKSGFLAGLIYASMVLPMFNSAGTVTHDIFAYPYLILSLYGILMFFRRKGFIKVVYAFICLFSLFLGRHVGPTIMVSAGTVVIYLLWQSVKSFLSPKKMSRYVAFGFMLAAAILLISFCYGGLSQVRDSMSWRYASKYVGQQVSVRGKIVDGGLTSPGGNLYLNFHENDRKSLSLEIPQEDLSKFPADAVSYYMGKKITASGRIVRDPYLRLILTDPANLQVTQLPLSTVLITAGLVVLYFLLWQLSRVIISKELSAWGAAVMTLTLLPLIFFVYKGFTDTTNSISWRDEYLAQPKSVIGKIVGAELTSPGGNLYLKFGKDREKSLSLKIAKEHLSKFPADAAYYYIGKTVTASGRIVRDPYLSLVLMKPANLKVSRLPLRLVFGAVAGFVVFYFFFWRVIFIRTGLDYFPFAVFLIITLGLVVWLHFQVMPPLMQKTFALALENRGVNVLDQIKAGSGDLLASSLGDYWLRFNFLLFFLPVGLYIAFKKKDMLGWALVMAAFLASRAADRGTRPLTFAFALMGALAFVNWKTIHSWVLAAWMAFIIGYFGGKYSLEYAVFFPVAAILIYLSLQWPQQHKGSAGSLVSLFCSLSLLLFGCIIVASPAFRYNIGFFPLPYVGESLLPAGGFVMAISILLTILVVGLIFYFIKVWIVDGRKPEGIWSILFFTLAWLMAGGILGGIIYRAKMLVKPEFLKPLAFINQLGQKEIAVLVGVINKYAVEIRKYWMVQICLFIPVLLMIVSALVTKVRPGRRKNEQEWEQTHQWFDSGWVQFLLTIASITFAVALLLLLIKYIVLMGGSTVFSKGSLFDTIVWRNLKFIVAVGAGALLFILLWPRRAEENRKFFTGVVVVLWLFATIIPSMNQTAKSAEGEYRAYKWLSENVPPGGRIFVPWSDGYMAEAVSNLTSELSPHNIDFQLPRLYWMGEEEAARVLRRKGMEYILISSKYFKLMGYNKKTGEFQYSFSPDIIYKPQQVGITTMEQLKGTALFKLLYQPRQLKKFQLLRAERDQAVNETYFVYKILP